MAANWSIYQVLDQLVTGDKWDGNTISYAFPLTPGGMHSEGENASFRPVYSWQQGAFTLAIQNWDDLIPQSFTLTTATSSNIEFAFTTSSINYAHAYFPSDGGSAWFKTGSDVDEAKAGDYGFTTIMHELGHALGLAHMGDYNGSGNWMPSSFQDSTVLSIMSYFGPGESAGSNGVMQADWTTADGIDVYPQTPMLNDVLAIQLAYGISEDTRAGNTVYGFSSNIGGPTAGIYDFTVNKNPVLTIFDSDGADTLNLSGWNTPSTVFLEDGVYSSVNGMTNNLVIAYGAVIENLIGGGGSDDLTGNDAANHIEGGAGADLLDGGDGDDELVGGAGNDWLDGGQGTDTAVFSAPFSSYSVSYDALLGRFTISAAATGTDLVSDVEFFRFGDTTKAASQLLTSDLAAPTLLSLSPADDASNVRPNANLTLSFSEAIKAGSGNIVIYTAAGVAVQTIAITDNSQVTISGNLVTINPAQDLALGTSYYVNLGAGVVKDLAGNDFAGFSGSGGYNFSTQSSLDTLAPTLTTMSPADNATAVAVGASLTLSFSEAIAAGSGNIDIYNSDNTLAHSISAADSSQVTIDGGKVIINPASDLVAGSSYYVNIDSGALKDLAGNAFAGISGSTAYNFSTAGTNPGDDYPWSTATKGVVTVNGTATTGVINTVDDSDLFKVELVKDTKYIFEMKSTPNGLADPYLQLFSPDVERLRFDDDGGDGLNARISYTATSSGTYYLGAEASGTGTGAYTVLASIDSAVPDDYSASVLTAGRISVGGEATGKIEVANDEDWFKISLQGGTTYVFELLGADSGGGTLGAGSAGAYLNVRDSSGYFLKSAYNGGSSGDPLMSFTPVTNGDYYLAASDLNGTSTGTYTLKARTGSDDYVDNKGTTGVLLIGGQTTGKIEAGGDADWFKVTLQAGTTYVFDLSGADSGGGTLGLGNNEAWMSLYGPTGSFLDSTISGGPGGDPRLAFTPITSGVYFVQAADLYGGGTGTYTVKAALLGAGVDDYLDNKSTTGFLAPGGQATGAIEVASDKDWFAIPLQAGKTYEFELRGADSGGGTFGSSSPGVNSVPYLKLYDTNGYFKQSEIDGGINGDPKMTFTPTISGKYYLGVDDLYGSGTGTYTVKATLVGASRAATADFDGDGKSDILWRHDTSGAATLWKGGSAAAQADLTTISDLNWQMVANGDFDGDGKSDILWHNNATGENTIWKHADFAARQTLGTVADLSWKIAGAADFDGDGQSDILWRNSVNGAMALWKHGDYVGQTSVGTVADTNWVIAGSGDFDGDGRADILWRNSATGEIDLWKHADAANRVGLTTVADLHWGIAGIGDFDGDGKGDILWRNNTTGENVIWKQGSAASRASLSTLADLNWKVAAVGDYDGDGKSDILWRNMANGADGIWSSGNFATRTDLATVDDLGWKPQTGGGQSLDAVRMPGTGKALGDFDGDGKSDILWRNSSTGENYLWNHGDFTARQALTTVSDLAWKISGTGDFDGDGKSDILWRNSGTGENYLWNHGDFASRQALTTVSDLAWKISGTGDFDGDGKSDILWRNSSTGENYLWNHGDFAARQALTTVSDLAWKISGTGDFDGDGKSDILWRNSSTGENYLWNHGDFAARQALTTVSDLAWKIAGTGDFDGDGKSDILWRNSATGEVDLWRHGDSAARQGLTTVADLAWKIAGTGDYDGDGKDDVFWRNSSTGEDVLWKGAVFANRISLTTIGDQAWSPMPGNGAAASGLAAQALYDSLDHAQFDFSLLTPPARAEAFSAGGHPLDLDGESLVFDFTALAAAPSQAAAMVNNVLDLATELGGDHHAMPAALPLAAEAMDHHPILTADLLHHGHASTGDYFLL